MTQDQELSEILDNYYAPIVLPDINRSGLKRAIEAYVTTRVKEAYMQGFGEGQNSMLYDGQITLITIEEADKRVKEAERLARIDELDKYNDSPLDWFYYEERRRSELKALTTTTNGNKE